MLSFPLVLILEASEKSVRTIYDGKKYFPPQVTKTGGSLRSAIKAIVISARDRSVLNTE